jgi:hypothetical protein
MTSRLTFILEEAPSNGGRATSEFIFRDLDRRRWTSGDPIVRRMWTVIFYLTFCKKIVFIITNIFRNEMFYLLSNFHRAISLFWIRKLLYSKYGFVLSPRGKPQPMKTHFRRISAQLRTRLFSLKPCSRHFHWHWLDDIGWGHYSSKIERTIRQKYVFITNFQTLS